MVIFLNTIHVLSITSASEHNILLYVPPHMFLARTTVSVGKEELAIAGEPTKHIKLRSNMSIPG